MNKQKINICILTGLFIFPLSSMAIEKIINFAGMGFIKIPAAEFIMGLKDRDDALIEVPSAKDDELMDELPAHKVSISHDFYIGETEVTQQQWFHVMENMPGDKSLWQGKKWQNLPVSSISWFMAERFIQEINKMDNVYNYRFPTEAEWEYVARAGSDKLRPVDEEVLAEYAWYIDSSDDKVHAVATKKPNAFGVYDMLGNLWEWVGDWYDKDSYKQKNKINPQGPVQGWSRVRRGGSYHCSLHLVRPGYRSANKPDTSYEVTGFRLVAELKN